MSSSGVEFDEDKFVPTHSASSSQPGSPNLGYGRPQPAQNTSKMAQWLMKHGVKSEHAAQAILVAVILFNIIITIVVITSTL